MTVLDLLYNLGTPHGHAASSLKIKMFETNNISIEESYILKRVLRGFRQLRSLVLWRVCDDAMLQILGVTCHNLLEVDIWKSTAATAVPSSRTARRVVPLAPRPRISPFSSSTSMVGWPLDRRRRRSGFDR